MKQIIRIIFVVITALFAIATFDSCTAFLKMPAKGFAKSSLRKATIKEGAENAGKTGKLGMKEAFSSTKVYTKLGYHSGKELCQQTVRKASQIPKLSSNYLRKQTAIGQKLQRIEKKSPINFTKKDMVFLTNNPDSAVKRTLRAINGYTGSPNNFQEFFIRLAKGDPNNVKVLLSNSQIKNYVNGAIRRSNGGGNHEWLMCKNFEDFLTNPKWGKNGNFLALSMTELVQKTENVTFKIGGAHGATNSKIFHDKLAEIIANSRTAHEVLGNINIYAREVLTTESYKEFRVILKDLIREYTHR